MQVFPKKSNRQGILILKEVPYMIHTSQGTPGVGLFKVSLEHPMGCLGCIKPRCMHFEEQEVDCDYIADFPHNKSTIACPVNAISLDLNSDMPVISKDNCINCGICVSRCPVGALYFDDTGELSLNTQPIENYYGKRKLDKASMDEHASQINLLLNTPHTGILMNASDQLFESIYNKLSRLSNEQQNLLCRNLLIALKCKCSMPRTGDVYNRMDAIYLSEKGTFGAAEVEFGKDTLDAVRAVLDDIAILNTRYNVPKLDNKALVVCLQLPNVRQGYWQVVKDIKDIVNIKVGTVTVGALMLLLWNRCSLKPECDRYYIDFGDTNLRGIICKQINCKDIPISRKKLGIIEPKK